MGGGLEGGVAGFGLNIPPLLIADPLVLYVWAISRVLRAKMIS